MTYYSNSGLMLSIKREETRRDLPKPKGKQHSPWGLHKTRVRLHSNRIDRMLDKHPRTSCMPMRYFDNMLRRFHENWGKK